MANVWSRANASMVTRVGIEVGDVASSCLEMLAVIAAPQGGVITAGATEAFLCSNHFRSPLFSSAITPGGSGMFGNPSQKMCS